MTRDDLEDGGAAHFAATVRALKANRARKSTVEILIPDFLGSAEALRVVVESDPHILNHNLETVPRLYPEVRPQADYGRSLLLLKRVKELKPGKITKSGLMLGLGEEREEILRVMADLRESLLRSPDPGAVPAAIGEASSRGPVRAAGGVRRVSSGRGEDGLSGGLFGARW